MKLVLLVAALFAANSSQLSPNPFTGTCPSYDTCYDTNLNISADQFLGVWFLAANIRYAFQENKKCTYINFYSPHADDRVNFIKYEFDDRTSNRRAIAGNFHLGSPNYIDITYSQLELPFPFRLVKMNCDFWVIVGCNECGFYTREGAGIRAYVFTRDQFPSPGVVEAYQAALEGCGVPSDSMIPQIQDDCNVWKSTE